MAISNEQLWVTYFADQFGVNLTATHNPPKDNGFKVGRHDGRQTEARHE